MNSLKDEIRQAIVPLGGWCTPEKANVLCDLIMQRRPAALVESGVWMGRSLIAMAMTLRYIGHGKIVGIDPWAIGDALQGDNGADHEKWWKDINFEDVYAGFVKSMVDLKLLRECQWLRMSSETATLLFRDASIDLFHLDSNHSELCSCRDVKSWLPKMKPKSIFVMDDTDWTTQQKAIQMIRDGGFKAIYNGNTYMVFER